MTTESTAPAADVLDVPVARLDGTAATARGIVGDHVALVVNVASRCGLTPQYAALERLQERYGDVGLTVVGLPCNQFGGQEPGTSEEIATFCSATYGVTFPLTEKIEVNGTGRHPLYAGLVEVPDEKGRTRRHRLELREVRRRPDRRGRGAVRAAGPARGPSGCVAVLERALQG